MSLKLYLSAIAFIACACNNVEQDGNDIDNKVETSLENKQKTIKDIEPALWKADSMQVLYYDNPDGDSLRYTRYFSYTETSDTGNIQLLLKEFNQKFTIENENRNCRSEGKIFLIDGENILKTIYFSSRGNSCTYLYFIKDGSFIYFPLTKGAQSFLMTNKRLAKKTKATS